MIRYGLALCIAAALGSGCSSSEELRPVPVDASTIADAEPTTDGGALDAGPPKRTIEQRNAFGNVAETENLLWDGDFEWFSAFSDQYGWLAGTSMLTLGYSFRDIRVGTICRSGLKCAGMAKKTVLAGIA